jgi:hypothetical protein
MNDSETLGSSSHFIRRRVTAVKRILCEALVAKAAIDVNEAQLVELFETFLIIFVLMFRLQPQKEVSFQRPIKISVTNETWFTPNSPFREAISFQR